MIFGKKVIEYKVSVLISSTTCIWNIFHFKKNSARSYHKYTWVFMWNKRYSCRTLLKLEISRLIFEKHSNIIIHEDSFSEGRVVPRGRTDRRTDMTNLIVAFCNFANAPKKRSSIWDAWLFLAFLQTKLCLSYCRMMQGSEWDELDM